MTAKQVTSKAPAPTTPEECLRRAMAAKTPRSRAMHARKGLAHRAPLETTVHAMLLRQLALALYETKSFRRAYEVALQALDLDVLADVLAQDAARAALASGELELALGHLRLAARRGPASRRPFHWWTLGSTLFLAARYDEAISALARAARWGTQPLTRAPCARAPAVAGEVAATEVSPAGQRPWARATGCFCSGTSPTRRARGGRRGATSRPS